MSKQKAPGRAVSKATLPTAPKTERGAAIAASGKCRKPYELVLPKGVTEAEMAATLVTSPFPRHASMQAFYASGVVNISGWPQPDLCAVMDQLTASADRLKAKNVGDIVDLLSAQALTLDAVSDKMLRRAEATDNLEAFERYMRLALKAQSSSRVTLEALAKVVRGGEQTVKHIHVDSGGQALIADKFINGAALPGMGEAGKSEGQSDAA